MSARRERIHGPKHDLEARPLWKGTGGGAGSSLALGGPSNATQAPRRRFLFPFMITPSETLERLLVELSADDKRRFECEATTLRHVSPTQDLYITATGDRTDDFLTPDEHGRPMLLLDVLSGPDAPAIFSGEGSLRLDFGTAKALQNGLWELERRYRAEQQTPGQTCASRLGLTPARAAPD